MATQTPDPPQGPCSAVEVAAPARLHLGFLDVSGSLGRTFGSLGLTLEGISTRVRVARASERSDVERFSERASHLLALLSERYPALGPLQLSVLETIPEHIGLGSGTQLGLAIAAAVAALAGERASAASLAALVDRGARSGIGVGAFETGGFLVDGGKGAGAAPAPIIARVGFPEAWRVILIFDHERRGLFGEAEKAAFRALPTFPADAAAHLSHLTLLRLLPALAEAAFDPVAEAIGEIGARVGDYFAPVQGGRFASPLVARALAWLHDQGFVGIGQSSWGPTGFALTPTEADARRAVDALSRHLNDDNVSLRVCAGRNRGAEIRRSPAVFEGRTFARASDRRDARRAPIARER
jgi:beta-ribofuranosylaminobenzene 5'-phosphate synthase